MRITPAVAVVLRLLLQESEKQRYGYELMRATGFASGKLYPLLARLHHAGWVDREWEKIDPVAAGRPARILYKLNHLGTISARQALAQQHAGQQANVRLPVRWTPVGDTA